MRRRELIEKGLTLGALACLPLAWGGERPPSAVDGPFWLVPAAPWPHFQICTEYPFPRPGAQPCCYPDRWRTERISYDGDVTTVTLRPYFDPGGNRLRLRLPPLADLSWCYGSGGEQPPFGDSWDYLRVGPGRPWRPPGPSSWTRALLTAQFEARMRGLGEPLARLPRAWRSGGVGVKEG